jgi:small conductance mechanosensitive channel
MNAEMLARYQETAVTLAMEYLPKVGLALLTLIVGLWIISSIVKLFTKTLTLKKAEPTLVPFLTSLLGWLLKVVLFISVAAIVGIQTTSFVAVLGAAGLAVGLALQGSLANFAGGVLILVFRPYKVGDLIKAQGELGVVKEIQIFTTTLLSPQNRRIIIPNGALSNGTVTNLTAEDAVRVDTTVGISYGADMRQARSVLEGMVKQIPGVLSEPPPTIAVSELGESSVNLVVRPYCHPGNYWDVFFATVEGSKRALDEAGISIPFPQRDVHLYQSKHL